MSQQQQGQQSFPITVHNCSNDEIIIRWWAPNGRDTSYRNIAARDRGMIASGFVGMDVFASRYNNASATYASLHLDQPASEIYFDDTSGGYGQGQMVAPREEYREVGMSFRGKQPADAPSTGQLEGQKGGDGGPVGVGSADPGSEGATLYPEEGGEGGEEGEEGAGLIYVPGMGYVNPEGIPPQIRRRIIMDRRRLMMEQQRQQPPQSRDPYGMEGGSVSYEPPLPSYDQAAADGSGEGGGGSGKLAGVPYGKYIIPGLVTLAIIAVLYFLFTNTTKRASL